MALGMEVGLGPSHMVLDGDTAPPIFGPLLFSPNGWMHQDATWYGGRPQPRRLCVRRAPSFPSPEGAQSPQFSANVRCGQTTGWTKMALCVEVGLGPGDFVFDGDPAIPRKKGRPTLTQFFGPCLLWLNGWMDQNTTWYETMPRPRRHDIVRWGPTTPWKGAQQPLSMGWWVPI